jgi:phosphoribosylanthranilate isomerase
MRTRVKICGITNSEDARAAIDYGADALGFILVPESPRYIENETGRLHSLLQSIPPFVTTVGVMKRCEEEDCPPSVYDFDAIQFYSGDCSSTITGRVRCIRAFSIQNEQSLEAIGKIATQVSYDALLLDTYHQDKLGGSGETFNWELAVEAKRRFDMPIILAGGLTPENVADAIAKVRPYAVDVSSSVEAEPGRKDHAKLKAFLEAVRKADAVLK